MSLVHVKKFVQGKQGITGLLKMDGIPYVYKTSQYMNHLCDHEYRIMNSLKKVFPYCPHFCRAIDILNLPINPTLDDPFKENTGIPIPVLLMEYIPDSIAVFDLIRDSSIPIEVIISLIKRIMLSVLIAQDKCGFVHYDLHTMNVLVRKCDEEVCLYILPDGTPFVVPTMGYEPIIIDFGFGSCSDMNGEQLTISLAYTDSGYISPYYDPISDLKILLVSLADDLKSYRPGKASQLRTIIKAFFKDLRIDWESGWDNDKEEPVIEEIVSYIENDDVESKLFNEYSHLAIDILHGLVTLPIKQRVERNIRSLRVSYNAIIHEFTPIEKVLNNVAYSLFVLRYIVDNARLLRTDFQNAFAKHDEPRVQELLHDFAKGLNLTIDKIVEYGFYEHNLKRLLVALYSFQDQLETQLHYRTGLVLKNKIEEYQNCKIHSPKEMYVILDTNFPLKVFYTDETVFSVFDAKNEIHRKFMLHPVEVESINKQHSFYHPRLLLNCWENASS